MLALALALYFLPGGPWTRKPRFPHLQKGISNILISGLSGFSKVLAWGMPGMLKRSVPGGSFNYYSACWVGMKSF